MATLPQRVTAETAVTTRYLRVWSVCAVVHDRHMRIVAVLSEINPFYVYDEPCLPAERFVIIPGPARDNTVTCLLSEEYSDGAATVPYSVGDGTETGYSNASSTAATVRALL